MGMIPMLGLTIVVMLLCVLIERLAKVNNNVLKVKKYLEENIFDGPEPKR